jgi:hypothetical protein
VAVIFYKRKIGLFKAIGAGLIIVTSFYMLGVVRNIGFSNASREDIVNAAATIDPLYGEFGTSYSVFGRALDLGISDDFLFGESYTVGPVLNLVPHALWSNRPDNLAIAFSKRYFNTDHLTEGLGFSPVLEAYLNFGRFGIVLVFAVFYTIITQLYDRHQSGRMRSVMLMAFALPVIINWNRIDISTAFKMYSGFIFMAYILPKILIRTKSV